VTLPAPQARKHQSSEDGEENGLPIVKRPAKYLDTVEEVDKALKESLLAAETGGTNPKQMLMLKNSREREA
jgi:hypothetical protein